MLQGHDAVRQSAEELKAQAPGARYDYLTCLTHGDWGFLEWRAESERARIDDGADSYVIRDGLIRMQTIHYTVVRSG